MSPDFDESYNTPNLWQPRKRVVTPRIEKYLESSMPEIAKERFARYDKYMQDNGHSFSYHYVKMKQDRKRGK